MSKNRKTKGFSYLKQSFGNEVSKPFRKNKVFSKSLRKRERLEVIHDFLRIINDNHNSIKPTPLLRKSNLSSQSFSEYYSELLSKGLIKEVINSKGKKYITLTDKGFRYLEKYKYIIGFIDEFEL